MIRLTAMLSGLLLWSAAARAQEKKERPGDTVSFELKNSIVFIEATVNGDGPFHFIFDTGAGSMTPEPRILHCGEMLRVGFKSTVLLESKTS